MDFESRCGLCTGDETREAQSLMQQAQGAGPKGGSVLANGLGVKMSEVESPAGSGCGGHYLVPVSDLVLWVV
jgi:hypothetical protein